MSSSMQWFRWHHGSVTDPKFNLVARRAYATLPEVLAVWAFLLETASASSERGHYGEIDCEAVDCLFGMDDGKTEAIMGQMQQRGLIESGLVCNWEKRQPKREREDDNSTERVRALRDRKRQAAQGNSTERHETPDGDGETPCNATERLDKRRGDKKEEANASVASGDLPACDFDSFVDLYHEVLPELPAVRLLNDQRRKAARGFWRWVLTSKKTDGSPRAQTADQALTWIRRYFERAKENDFLMGRHEMAGKHANWRADFDFLLTEKGKKHVIEKTEVAA